MNPKNTVNKISSQPADWEKLSSIVREMWDEN
jgi:hypothetical protein